MAVYMHIPMCTQRYAQIFLNTNEVEIHEKGGRDGGNIVRGVNRRGRGG